MLIIQNWLVVKSTITHWMELDGFCRYCSDFRRGFEMADTHWHPLWHYLNVDVKLFKHNFVWKNLWRAPSAQIWTLTTQWGFLEATLMTKDAPAGAVGRRASRCISAQNPLHSYRKMSWGQRGRHIPIFLNPLKPMVPSWPPTPWVFTFLFFIFHLGSPGSTPQEE